MTCVLRSASTHPPSRPSRQPFRCSRRRTSKRQGCCVRSTVSSPSIGRSSSRCSRQRRRRQRRRAARTRARAAAAAAAAAEADGTAVVEEYTNPWAAGDVWSGNYQSGANVRNCRFTVVSSQGSHVRLVFDFETPRNEQGAFVVSGDFDKTTGEILLKPECWVNALRGMTMVRFRMGSAHTASAKDSGKEAEVCWGEVLHPSCGPIVLWKLAADAAKAAASVPMPALVSAEGDDAPDAPSVSVLVTHKRSEVKRYSAASTPTVIRHKVGTPIVVSVKGSMTSGEVREMIEQRAKAMGANTDLPHKLIRASKHNEEDPRYHQPAGSRVGEEVPLNAEDATKTFLPPSHDGMIKLVMAWGEVKENEVFPNAKGGPDATAEEEKDSTMQLSSCLDLFTVQEQLSEQEAWYCPRCKEHKCAFKKMDIWSAPPILVLHFKRFSVDASSFWTEKLETAVKFPLELDISKYVLNPGKVNTYSLAAVSNHFGGMGGGHYTAYGRNDNGKWFEFDDSAVSEVGDVEKTFDYSAAYVIFYIRDDYCPDAWRASAEPHPDLPES
mmetsp:Transcript_6564/g.11531  ORF Transcript_6564/g.11531 Transcript_6564/m.11531 type:complete len:553 (-) Transcript_6564:99-1757(-)